jgi:hypothetical protein
LQNLSAPQSHQVNTRSPNALVHTRIDNSFLAFCGNSGSHTSSKSRDSDYSQQNQPVFCYQYGQCGLVNQDGSFVKQTALRVAGKLVPKDPTPQMSTENEPLIDNDLVNGIGNMSVNLSSVKNSNGSRAIRLKMNVQL